MHIAAAEEMHTHGRGGGLLAKKTCIMTSSWLRGRGAGARCALAGRWWHNGGGAAAGGGRSGPADEARRAAPGGRRAGKKSRALEAVTAGGA